MTTPVGVWQITDSGPRRLAGTDVDLERHLEDWFERNPSLLGQGLTIVGRQMVIEGGRLDLLAVDIRGRLNVIEIKAGVVRRTTVAQAIDYASCLASMPESELAARIDDYLGRQASASANGAPRTYASLMEDLTGEAIDVDAWSDSELRDVAIQVVGTGRDPGLERMINYLAAAGEIDVSVVSFEVFETASGERVLIRELTEADAEIVERRESGRRPRATVDEILALADRSGIGEPFRMIYDAATEVGLHPRPYKHSIMYTPPSNKTRCVIYSRATPESDGRLRLYVAAETIEEFFGVPARETRGALENAGLEMIRPERDGDDFRIGREAVLQFARVIRELFSRGASE